MAPDTCMGTDFAAAPERAVYTVVEVGTSGAARVLAVAPTDDDAHRYARLGPVGVLAGDGGPMSDYRTEIPATLDHGDAPAEHLRSAVVVESGEWGDDPAVSLEVMTMGEGCCVHLTPAEALRVAEALSRMARLAIDPEEVTRD